ncbi:MAG: hypothetical protein ACFFC3_14785 [Candidatus Odinarchaeota archaeon]
MNSDSNRNKEIKISKSRLKMLRMQKIQKEIEAAKRLINKNVDILEIANKFIHSTFELVKDGISNRNIDLTEDEIQQQIRNNILFKEKIKLLKKEYNQIG